MLTQGGKTRLKVYSKLDRIPSGQASDRLTDGCLLLEGGAFRGVFTSGVLDCLMVNDVNLRAAVGVSAGALNAYNYIAGAIGRSARVNLTYRHDSRWVGRKAIKENKGIVGFSFLMNELAEILPFDYDKLMSADRRLIAVATNCLTGEAEFFEKDCGCIEQAVRASASMPIVSEMVDINGKPYLDGGCADRIPLDWVLAQGFEKILVVRTRPKGFRREEKEPGKVERMLYKKYPAFLEAMKESNVRYNRTCDKLEQLEAEGKLLVICPSGENAVSRLEGDMEKLGALYFEGYNTTQARMEEIKCYLK